MLQISDFLGFLFPPRQPGRCRFLFRLETLEKDIFSEMEIFCAFAD